MNPLVSTTMSVSEYRSHPALNQSLLKHLAKSPAHLQYAIHHPKPATEAMEFGSLVDHLFFGTPFKWKESLYPDFRSNAAKDWRDDQLRAGFTIFKPDRVAEARAIVTACQARKSVQAILGSGTAQVAMFADLDGVACKGLADWISDSVSVIADLKTTGKTAAATVALGDDETSGLSDCSEWGRTVVTMGYDVQAAWYCDLFHAATGEQMMFAWIVAESDPPHEVAVWYATPAVIERGRRIYKGSLAIYRQCAESGIWPGYPDLAQYVELPRWAV